jgi:hypothetical protein
MAGIVMWLSDIIVGKFARREGCNRRIFANTLLCLFFIIVQCASQTNPHFNVDLHLDYSALEQTIRIFDDEPVGTQSLSEFRGNRIAASTTGLIANRESVTSLLQNYLDSLKFHQIIRDDIYHLEEGRKNVSPIKELYKEMERSNFNRKVIATVEQIFPQDAEVSINIPVYVVAFGHENVDAFVRRVIWHGDIPEFVGEHQGELTIVINLSHAVRYGSNLQERYLSLLGVVAHEVFHAAFGDYKDRSPFWKQYSETHRQPFDALIDLTQNEGIAYYLSIDQRGHGYVPHDWYQHARDIFSIFNRNASELLSKELTRERASELIRSANLNGYEGSYGSQCGMFIAREIDLRLGRSVLIETISGGPIDMFQKYASLTASDNSLPKFSPIILRTLSPR